MQDTQLSITDVHSITGIPSRMIASLCEEGYVTPYQDARGTGTSRKFSLMQVVGFAIAGALADSQRGCRTEYIAQIVDAFGAMKQSDLEGRIAKGKTRLIAVRNGKPELRGSQHLGALSIDGIYTETTRKINELIVNGQQAKRGRPRKLRPAAR